MLGAGRWVIPGGTGLRPVLASPARGAGVSPVRTNIRPMSMSELQSTLNTIMNDHARLWRIRSREGGLAQSLEYYRALLEDLQP